MEVLFYFVLLIGGYALAIYINFRSYDGSLCDNFSMAAIVGSIVALVVGAVIWFIYYKNDGSGVIVSFISAVFAAVTFFFPATLIFHTIAHFARKSSGKRQEKKREMLETQEKNRLVAEAELNTGLPEKSNVFFNDTAKYVCDIGKDIICSINGTLVVVDSGFYPVEEGIKASIKAKRIYDCNLLVPESFAKDNGFERSYVPEFENKGRIRIPAIEVIDYSYIFE